MNKRSDSRRFSTRVSEIWLDADGIMNIEFKANAEIGLADMQEADALFRQMGFGQGRKKSRQLLKGGPFTLSREARAFAALTGTDFFHAAAMVTDSVMVRYVVNLFNALNKHKVPFKVFSDEKKALEWLKSFPGN